MTKLDYGLFDADNHYYEPSDCFTRHIDPKHRAKAVHLRKDAKGNERVFVGDRLFTFLEGNSFAGPEKMKPGSFLEMVLALKQNIPLAQATKDVMEPTQEAYVNREARLALMDKQGVESVFMFPTLGVCVEHFMKDDPEQMYANLSAFNRWLLDDWGFDHKGRIYGVPLISLLDRDRAVEELEWTLRHGAKIINLRPGPAFGRSPADPYFDRFWARVNEAKLTVALHLGESGYNEMMGVHWGEKPNPTFEEQSALQWTCFHGDRIMMDTIAAFIFHNLFGRYRNVKIASIENGSMWVAYLLDTMDRMKELGMRGPWPGGYVKEVPSALFKRHVFVSPYPGEDVNALISRIGADQIIFGSDFPHPEGVAEPAKYVDFLGKLPAQTVRKIMRDNALSLVNRSVA